MKKFFIKLCSLVLLVILIGTNVSCAKKIEYNITKDEALGAVMNYNYKNIPGLKEMVESDDYQIYWDIASYDDDQIVVVFRSYTGSINRYYIDVKTGETYVTEFVPGIMDEETEINEKFNVRDYIS